MQRIIGALDELYSTEWISRTNGTDLVNQKVGVHNLSPIIKSGFLFYAFINVLIFFKLLFKKCDIICAVDLDTVLPCYLISKLRRKKLVFDSHEYFTEVPELIGRGRVKNFWQIIANFTLPKIQYNYTVGQRLSEIFSEQYGQPYETIMNISDLDNQGQKLVKAEVELGNLKKPQKQLVYLGVLNQGRGIELAIRAVAELPEITLLLIGSGDLDVKLKELAKEIGVIDRVSFLGYVEPADIYKHLSNSWVALNLLEEQSSSYYYSLANKFFDYMNCEIPSINMDFPEYQFILNKYPFGVLIKEYSVASLINGIHQYFDEDFHERAVQASAKGQVEYNWKVERLKLLKFYEKMEL